MKHLNLKERVKHGNLNPTRAYNEMMARLDTDEQRVAAAKSRTAKWLRSPNARKRFEAANKGA